MWTARFSDGRSAASKAVSVRLSPDALIIEDDAGSELDRWPLGQLEQIDEPTRAGEVRLKRGAGGAGRLTVAEAGFGEALREAAPHLHRGPDWRLVLRRTAIWGANAGAIVLLLVFGIPRLAGTIAAIVPVAWERALGEQVLAQVVAVLGHDGEEGTATCNAPAGRAALDKLVARLASGIDTPYRFNVVVIRSRQVNALALPGGHIVVLGGLLEFAASADEVAAVLAHEMAHVAGRHVTRAMIRNMGYGLILEAMIGGSGLGGSAADVGTFLLTTSYSRRAETEADTVGRSILHEAGLASGGLAPFFERLAEKYGDLPESLAFLSSHPSVSERTEASRAAAQKGDPALDASGWRALTAICE